MRCLMPGARPFVKPLSAGESSESSASDEVSELELQSQRQLEEDVARIFDESIYSDLEVVCGKLKILTNSCILKARTHKFYHKLETILHVNIGRNIFDEIYSFISDAYTECDIKQQEKEIIDYLNENLSLGKNVIPDNKNKPEEKDEPEVYSTPNCVSPEEKNYGNTLSLSPSTELTKEYYALVPIDSNVLERELIEQDALTNAFQSINKFQFKDTNAKRDTPCIKPASLCLNSSQKPKINEHSNNSDILKKYLPSSGFTKKENVFDEKKINNGTSQTRKSIQQSGADKSPTIHNKSLNLAETSIDKVKDPIYTPDSLITDEPSSSSDYLSAACAVSPGTGVFSDFSQLNVGESATKMENIVTISDSGLETAGLLESLNSHKDVTLTDVSLTESTLHDMINDDSICQDSMSNALDKSHVQIIKRSLSLNSQCCGTSTGKDFNERKSNKSLFVEMNSTSTKEEKQRQNEEIVILESSSLSSETGSWESVFPPKLSEKDLCEKFITSERKSALDGKITTLNNTSNLQHEIHDDLCPSLVQKSPYKSTSCFIDAASLADECDDTITVQAETKVATISSRIDVSEPSELVPCTLNRDLSPNDWSGSNDNDDSLEQEENIYPDLSQKYISSPIFEVRPSTGDPLEIFNAKYDLSIVRNILADTDEADVETDKAIYSPIMAGNISADTYEANVETDKAIYAPIIDGNISADTYEANVETDKAIYAPIIAGNTSADTYEANVETDKAIYDPRIAGNKSADTYEGNVLYNRKGFTSTHDPIIAGNGFMKIPHESNLQDLNATQIPIVAGNSSIQFCTTQKLKSKIKKMYESESENDSVIKDDNNSSNRYFLDNDGSQSSIFNTTILYDKNSLEKHDITLSDTQSNGSLTKREIGNIPIVSGAYIPESEDTPERPPRTLNSSFWVVDMSNNSKSNINKSSIKLNSESVDKSVEELRSISKPTNSVETYRNRSSADSDCSEKSTHKFYIDLSTLPDASTSDHTQDKDEGNEKKNMFSMFIDLGDNSTAAKEKRTRFSSTNKIKNIENISSSKGSKTPMGSISKITSTTTQAPDENVLFEKLESLCADTSMSISEIINCPLDMEGPADFPEDFSNMKRKDNDFSDNSTAAKEKRTRFSSTNKIKKIENISSSKGSKTPIGSISKIMSTTTQAPDQNVLFEEEESLCADTSISIPEIINCPPDMEVPADVPEDFSNMKRKDNDISDNSTAAKEKRTRFSSTNKIKKIENISSSKGSKTPIGSISKIMSTTTQAPDQNVLFEEEESLCADTSISIPEIINCPPDMEVPADVPEDFSNMKRKDNDISDNSTAAKEKRTRFSSTNKIKKIENISSSKGSKTPIGSISKIMSTTTQAPDQNVLFEEEESLCADTSISIPEIINCPPDMEVPADVPEDFSNMKRKDNEFISNVIKEKPSAGEPLDLFVKLSDLDKPAPKVESVTTIIKRDNHERMSRSIPDNNWRELNHSINIRTSEIINSFHSENALSLNRLFPHLKNDFSRSMPGSLSSRTRLPLRLGGVSSSSGDIDERLGSDVSEISSVQSSYCRSIVENSTTEEIDQISSLISNCQSRLGQDLLRMFLEEIAPDVIVEVSGRRIKAHKCILSSRCQYFAGILSGGWVESAGNVISLPSFAFSVVHFVLCHIYSGVSVIPESINIVEVSSLADLLGLEGLKEGIMFTLKDKYCHNFHEPCSVCMAGVLECLPVASLYGLDDLYRKSLRWITKHFFLVWPSKAFAKLPFELIEKCCQENIINLSADNFIETVFGCGITVLSLATSRWAGVVARMCQRVLNAAAQFAAARLCEILRMTGAVANEAPKAAADALEDCLTVAIQYALPDQACRAYYLLSAFVNDPRAQLDFIADGDLLTAYPNSLLSVRAVSWRLLCEGALVRNAPRVVHTSAFANLPIELRSRLREFGCIPYGTPSAGCSHDARRPSSARSPRVACAASSSRHLDIDQVRACFVPYAPKPQPQLGSIDSLAVRENRTHRRDLGSSSTARSSKPREERPASKKTLQLTVRTTKAQEERAKYNSTKTHQSVQRGRVVTRPARAAYENAKPRYMEPRKAAAVPAPAVRKPQLKASSSESSRNSSPVLCTTRARRPPPPAPRPHTAGVSTDSISETQTDDKYATYTKAKHNTEGSVEAVQKPARSHAVALENTNSQPITKIPPKATKIPVYVNKNAKASNSVSGTSKETQLRVQGDKSKPVSNSLSPVSARNKITERKPSGSLMNATKSSQAKMVSKTTPSKNAKLDQSKSKNVPRSPAAEIPVMERSGTFLKDEPTFGDKTTDIDEK